MFDRHINNELLGNLSRPQYPQACSVAALTMAINYLFGNSRGIRTQEEVAAALGFHADAIGIEGGPGNEIVLGWYRDYAAAMGWQAACGILLNGENATDESTGAPLFDALKSIIKGRETVLVHHLEHHYNIVCGYLEHAQRPSEACAASAPSRRWLILADSSTKRDPIWSIAWTDMREDFRNDRRHCLLALSRLA